MGTKWFRHICNCLIFIPLFYFISHCKNFFTMRNKNHNRESCRFFASFRFYDCKRNFTSHNRVLEVFVIILERTTRNIVENATERWLCRTSTPYAGMYYFCLYETPPLNRVLPTLVLVAVCDQSAFSRRDEKSTVWRLKKLLQFRAVFNP